jgi:hypothetical protein
LASGNGGDGLEVVRSTGSQGDGDGALGVVPGEGEWLAGHESTEDAVGELDLGLGNDAGDEGGASNEDGSETHFG